MTGITTLEQAIADAVAATREVSDQVLEALDATEAVLASGTAELKERGADAGGLHGDLDGRLAMAATALQASRRHAQDRRTHLDDFRVAMFGRTRVGKSSLIEALTEGDAATVSPGRGDHTEDVREVRWGPLLVVDMPGTLGAGRRLSREELEARTEAEVKRADLVVLAFDSENQQLPEFQRAAEMVLRYRKPVVTVLNVKNPDWRSPDPAVTLRQRRKRDVAVRQQFSYLDHELARIGVHACPIVAINTQRATFARCVPYRGPELFHGTRDRQVAAYGRALLEEASNIAALEDVVVRTISHDCAALRRNALLGDLEAGVAEVRAVLSELPSAEMEVRTVERVLRELGYPRAPKRGTAALASPPLSAKAVLDGLDLGTLEADAVKRAEAASVLACDGVLTAAVTSRAGDELSRLETERGRPFDAPAAGAAHRRVRRALNVAFTHRRLDAQRRAEDLVLQATKNTHVDLAEEVLQFEELTDAAEAAVAQVVNDLCAAVKLGAQQVGAGFALDEARVSVRPGGGGDRLGMIAARVGSLGTSTALVVAATNFWNPGGWTAMGLAVGSFAASQLGSQFSRRAERKRLDARAASLAEARGLVDRAFDELEAGARRTIWAAMTTIGAALLVPPLRRATDVLLTQRLAAALGAVEQPAPGPPASRAPLPAAHVLLGAHWLPPRTVQSAPVHPPADPSAFATLGWTPVRSPADADLALEEALARLHLLLGDPDLEQVAARVEAVLDGDTRIGLCGDVSAAKSSLRAVLTLTAGDSRRRVRRGAARTTTAVETGRLGKAVIVDTPGFGTSVSRDAEVAERAVEDASLLLYLVTPRLIADLPMRLLDDLSAPGLRGSVALRRTRFVLTRIDELGVLPDEAPDAFATAVNGKRAELARILTERGIPISYEDVVVVAPDPFGSDFDESVLARSAAWSGTDRLREELLAHPTDRRGRTPGALYAALIALERARAELADFRDADSLAITDSRALERSARRAEQDTRRLADELAARLRAAVTPVLSELIGNVLATRGDAQKIAVERASSWWEDPRVATAVRRWQEQAAIEVRQHSDAVGTDLARQFDARPSFSAHAPSDTAPLSAVSDTSMVRVAGQTAGHLGSSLKGLDNVKVLKMRDALRKLPIPSSQLKFKPWGAHKLASKARVAGKAAAVAGLALEAGAIIADERNKRRQEQLRQNLRRDLVRASDEWVAAVVRGEDDAPGVQMVLGRFAGTLGTISEGLEENVSALQARVEHRIAQLSRIDKHTGRTA